MIVVSRPKFGHMRISSVRIIFGHCIVVVLRFGLLIDGSGIVLEYGIGTI